MAYPGPQPISPSPLAGVLDDDLLNAYNQFFPGGKPQKPQYQSSSLAGSYQNFLGSPSSSSSSGSGQNTDWSKYVDNHSDLSQAYLDYESQAVANGDIPKPKWAWGKDHYQEFGKNESSRNLTGVSQDLIEEVAGPPAMTSYDQITQAIIDQDTNNNNANAQINALNRQSDDYRTDVTAQTQLLGSLVNLQGVREGEKGALERLGISEAEATARQDSANETLLGVETLRGDNAIDVQEIANAGLAAVATINQDGAANVANIQKEASAYAADSEKDWRNYGAELDAEARLGAALAQKEGVLGSAETQKEGLLGSADIRGKADIRVGELQSEASKFSASKDAEARLGAAQAQKEAILGAENIKAKGALDLQPIINAGLADVARLNKEAALGAAEITGKYGVEEEKVRGMSAKDVAKIQSRGNVFGSLVSAFNF